MLSIALVLLGSPALAEAPPAEPAAETEAPTADAASAASGFSMNMGVAFGCGMIILGAGYGISKIGSCAVESMARQPEVAAPINTAMIISAALIEGVTFFALIVCLLRLFIHE
jgi:F-type H+-transporting ATPase subunit c